MKISCFLPYIKVTIIFRWKKYYPDTFTNEIKRPHGEVSVYTPRHSSRHASDHVLCQGHQGRILCRHHVHRSCIIIACRALGNISRHRESLCVIVRVVSVSSGAIVSLCVWCIIIMIIIIIPFSHVNIRVFDFVLFCPALDLMAEVTPTVRGAAPGRNE